MSLQALDLILRMYAKQYTQRMSLRGGRQADAAIFFTDAVKVL